MPLSDVLARIPGYGGYRGAEQANQQADLGQIQQAQGLMAILGAAHKQQLEQNALAQQAAYRQGLRPDMTHEEQLAHALKFIGPKESATLLQGEANKKITAAALAENVRQRLKQQADQFDQSLGLKYAQLDQAEKAGADKNTIAQYRLALDMADKSFKQKLAQEHLSLTGAKANYETGVALPNIPALNIVPSVAGAPAAAMPVGRPTVPTVPGTNFSMPSTEDAANPDFQKVLNAAAGGRQETAGGGPIEQSAGPVVTVPPNNLDARDLRLAAQPVAPVVAPPVMPAYIASAPQKIQDKWKADQAKTSVAGAGAMNAKAIRLAAEQYVAGDRTAVQGLARDQKTAQAVRNEIAKVAEEQGIKGKELAAITGEYEGFKSGQRALGTRQAQIEMAATVTKQFAPLAITASENFDRTGFKSLNDVEKAVLSRTASPELRKFNFANNALINAYARAVNPTGVGTVHDKEHAREILDTGFSKGDYKAAVEQLGLEIDAELKAPGSVKKDMRGLFTGNTKTETVPEFATEADAAKAGLKSGTKVKIGGRPGTWQ